MKSTTLIILITLSAWVTLAQQKIVKYYPSGKIRYESFVKDNLLDITYIEYYENGNKKAEGTFNKRTYKTSSVSIIQMICGTGVDTSKPAEGIKNGVWKSYYENGKLSTVSNYFGNIRVGQYLSYDITGRIEENEFYNAGKLIQKQEYYNGILESFLTRIYKDIKDKKYKSLTTTHTDLIHEYYETGELKCVKQLNNDGELMSTYTEYWPNGFIKLTGVYKADKKTGIFKEYYANGNTNHEGVFKDDSPQGKQYYCNEQGKVVKIELWKNNKLVSTELKTGK